MIVMKVGELSNMIIINTKIMEYIFENNVY